MALSHELISQFAKLVNQGKKTSAETTVYGTVVVDGENKYVRVDGSDQLIPIEDGTTVADANADERVSILIKDHTATVTGNVSSPAARTGDVKDVTDRVTQIEKFDLVLAERIEAQEGYIEDLQADMAEIGDLKAATAKIEQLEANDIKITGDLEASNAKITNLETTKLDVDVADAKFATIDKLNADTAEINELLADKASVTDLKAAEADITKLNAEKASAKDLEAVRAEINDLDATFATVEKLDAATAKIEDLKAEDAKINGTLTAHNAAITNLNSSYATIDFANIKMAAVEKLFSTSGIIKDLVVGDTSITGELVGVTLKGDLIEAGTVKADKLVVKGSDGIFYKLNVEAGGISAEEAPDDGLHGSSIVAKSITATKVNVHDLVAFGATIGHFHIYEKLEEESEDLYLGTEDNILFDFKSGYGIYEVDRVVNASEENGHEFHISFTDGSYCEGWYSAGEPTDIKPGEFIKYDSDGAEYIARVTVKRSDGALYSGVKADVNNTTEGIYMDSTGQFNVGNSSNFLKFFKDQNGKWKLNISADSITFGTGDTGKKSVEDAIDEVIETLDAKLEVSAESVKTEVSKTYATKQEVDNVQIGGRNLLLNSSFKESIDEWKTIGDILAEQKTVSGHQVVRADNVSDNAPATVQLASKNLLNLTDLYGKTVTSNGGTLSCGADGGVTGSGTPTGYITLCSKRIDLPTDIYTLSVSGSFSGITCDLSMRDVDGASITTINAHAGRPTHTFDLNDYPNYSYFVLEIKRGADNVEMSGTVYCQLERGSAATPYTQYVGSKNEIQQSLFTTATHNGITLTYIPEEDCFCLNGAHDSSAGTYSQCGCTLATHYTANGIVGQKYTGSIEYISGSVNTNGSKWNVCVFFGAKTEKNELGRLTTVCKKAGAYEVFDLTGDRPDLFKITVVPIDGAA